MLGEELISRYAAFLHHAEIKGLGSRPRPCPPAPGLGCLDVAPPCFHSLPAGDAQRQENHLCSL